MQRHNMTSLETARSLANGPSWEGGGRLGRGMYSAFPGNCSVSYLSFVYGRSLWAELNGGGNSLHWKANMLPLFSFMTLWFRNKIFIQLSLPLNPIILTSLKYRVTKIHVQYVRPLQRYSVT